MGVTRTNIPSIRSAASKHGLSTKPATYIIELHSKSSPDGEPIAYLLIQREERQGLRRSDGGLFDAEIELTYTEIIASQHSQTVAKKGWFNACYAMSLDKPLISLTASKPCSSGYVVIEMEHLKGHRLGTYLMNEIVTWAKRWPDASVLPINLLKGQAYR